jgi:polysaccharide pyruvyl transferase WcaK-like protein
MAGVATICLAYEEKCHDFAEFLGQEELVLRSNDEDATKIETILDGDIHTFIKRKTE